MIKSLEESPSVHRMTAEQDQVDADPQTKPTNFSHESTCRLLLSVLLSSRPGLGLEDTRGHLLKVLALALAPQVLALALALREKSCQDFSSKIQATWLLYVYALLTYMVSHNSLPFLAQECFTDLHIN